MPIIKKINNKISNKLAALFGLILGQKLISFLDYVIVCKYLNIVAAYSKQSGSTYYVLVNIRYYVPIG